jgi:hypothetical protein
VNTLVSNIMGAMFLRSTGRKVAPLMVFGVKRPRGARPLKAAMVDTNDRKTNARIATERVCIARGPMRSWEICSTWSRCQKISRLHHAMAGQRPFQAHDHLRVRELVWLPSSSLCTDDTEHSTLVTLSLAAGRSCGPVTVTVVGGERKSGIDNNIVMVLQSHAGFFPSFCPFR